MSTDMSTADAPDEDVAILIDDRDLVDKDAAAREPWTPHFRSPAQVALTAIAVLVAIIAAVHSGVPGGPVGVVTWVALAGPITVLAVIDARTYRLPFVISVPMFLIVLVAAGVASFINGGVEQLGWMGIATGVPFALSFIAYWFGLQGLGDVPLIAAMGAALSLAGPGTTIAGLLFIPCIVGLILYPLTGRKTGKRYVPFGVALAFGAVGAMAFHPSLEALLLSV